MPSTSLLPILITVLLVGPAIAQRVDIYGGGAAVGQAKVSEQGGTQQVWVKLDDQVVLSIPKARVRTIEPVDKLARYFKFAGLTGDDPERHFKLSRWCKGESLPHQARYHLQRVIALDPDHTEARAILRYTRVAGEWIKWSTLQRQRGLVHVGGNKWEAPELIAREKARKADEVAAKKWTRTLRQMLSAVARGEEDALQNLAAIEDPLAADAVADQLMRSRDGSQTRQLRRLWVRLLGKFKNASSVKTLVQTGIDEPDFKIREAALEQLEQHGRRSAVSSYANVLVEAAAGKHANDSLVRRAAVALQSFPDPEMAFTYVDALVTEHVRTAAPAPGMSFGFGDNGVGGIQAGGAPQAEVLRSENLEVLNLLRMIAPDVNYGFNEDAWRQYFAARRSRFDGDLRRDP